MTVRYNCRTMPAKNPLFASPKPVIAMIHVEALPGTPASLPACTKIEKHTG
jgi:predicted TIM-barrel enzyme